jgi:5-methylcytosine-specific restriction endonuclease McrA
MPINYKQYHPDWPAMSKSIRAAAGWVCQGSPAYPDCRAVYRQPHPVTGADVVLTVAHLDHDRDNYAPDNLRALCQRCHLTHDAKQHAETRQKNREQRRMR